MNARDVDSEQQKVEQENLLQSYRGLLQANDLIYEERAKYVSDCEKVPRRFLIGIRYDNLYSTQM